MRAPYVAHPQNQFGHPIDRRRARTYDHPRTTRMTITANGTSAGATLPEENGRLSKSASHWLHHAPTAEALAEGIWSDLTAWCGDQSHHDDMILLILRTTLPSV